jgi:hypothetical protein
MHQPEQVQKMLWSIAVDRHLAAANGQITNSRNAGVMRTAACVLMALGVACEAFGYWGLNTVAGRRAFNEMAGMIPVAAMVLGALFALVSAFAFWRSTRATGTK